MDSHLPQSKSVPSSLTVGKRHLVSISGSGSYQSHLSSLGHLHRIRTTSEQVSLSSPRPGKDYLQILEDGLAEQRPHVERPCLMEQFITDPGAFLSDDLRRIRSGHVWRPRTLFTLYCCLSVLVLTIRIHTFFQEVLQAAKLQRHQSWRLAPDLVYEPDHHGLPRVSLTNVPLSQRLSIAFRGLPPQAHLSTFIVRARPDYESDLGLTACLWIEDTRMEEALVSVAAWPGPVSLVVVTPNAPNSTRYKRLIGRLTATHAPSASISAHVLYVPSVAGGSSNAYLNMARFFAPTSRVILFPGGIPQSTASKNYARWLDTLPVNTPHPVLLSNMTHKVFAPRPLAPVVLPKDHRVWCMERLYMFGSRVLDWEDCLWSLWLESAGEASSVTVPRLLDESINTTSMSVSPFATKVRLRWSAKYRSEACAFTFKRSQALESSSRVEKRHIQWRKRFCRETAGLGTLEIP